MIHFLADPNAPQGELALTLVREVLDAAGEHRPCGAQSPTILLGYVYYCTREEGHPRAHVATDSEDLVCMVWSS